jgi:hypothetical protein
MLIGKYSSSAHELLLQFLLGRARSACHCVCWCCLCCVRLSCRMNSSSAVVASLLPESCVLRALGRARRRIASSRHSVVGCRCAPRPGARPAGSGTTSRPAPRSPATTRSNSSFVARCRQPTHVRTLPPVSREDTRHPASDCGGEPPTSLAAPGPPAEHDPGERPLVIHRRSQRWAAPPAVGGPQAPRRSVCRSATRSAGRPAERSAPPCRSPGRAGSRVRRPGPTGRRGR